MYCRRKIRQDSPTDRIVANTASVADYCARIYCLATTIMLKPARIWGKKQFSNQSHKYGRGATRPSILKTMSLWSKRAADRGLFLATAHSARPRERRTYRTYHSSSTRKNGRTVAFKMTGQ